jgi:hypothetical protein
MIKTHLFLVTLRLFLLQIFMNIKTYHIVSICCYKNNNLQGGSNMTGTDCV